MPGNVSRVNPKRGNQPRRRTAAHPPGGNPVYRPPSVPPPGGLPDDRPEAWLGQLKKSPWVPVVLVDLYLIQAFDLEEVEALVGFRERLRGRGQKLILCNLPAKALLLLMRLGLAQQFNLQSPRNRQVQGRLKRLRGLLPKLEPSWLFT